jgi:hypothetical protein
MIKKILITFSIILILSGCLPESKLLNKTYIAEKSECSKMDTVFLGTMGVKIRDKYIFFSKIDSSRIKTALHQVPIKLSRKLGEYGVALIAAENPNSITPNILLRDTNTNIRINYDSLIPNISNSKYRYYAIYLQAGYERSTLNTIIMNFPFYLIRIATLGIIKVRWNEGESRARLILYDKTNKKPIFYGVNTKYIDPGDSISINKHLEIIIGREGINFNKEL